jgi:SpoVK/Ycf46/Vps4 family AAA+-type ATPase
LDEAGTRSGRIDKEVHIGKPDKEARGKIFRAQLSDRPAELTSDEMLTLAERTDGMVAADIETIVESGAKKVLVNGEDTITYEHLVEAINGMED